jgi:hypothetical protein
MTSTWTDIVSPAAAIGDQFTAERANQVYANLDFLRNPPSDIYTPATNAANITTTSTSFVDLTGFTTSITTQGGAIRVDFRVRANSTSARFDILLDNVSLSGDNDGFGAVTPASTFGNNSFFAIVAASAGAHTIKIQWRVTAGTGTVYPAGLCQLYVTEIGAVS